MDTLIKSTLLSSVSAGGRVKAPRQPNIWCGSADNGYTPGDLVDANGLVEFIIENDILHDDPSFRELKEKLETEASDREAAVDSLRNYVDAKITSLIDGAPDTLDTLRELAESIGNDADFINTIIERIVTVETDVHNKTAEISGNELIINI